MAFPTVVVTPGSGQTINTLPNAGQATGANSLPVVTASDDPVVVATGTQADSAWSSGSGSIVSVLKGIFGKLNLAIPTGSNVIGGITIADGSDVTQGLKADTAYSGSGSASVVAALKGI